MTSHMKKAVPDMIFMEAEIMSTGVKYKTALSKDAEFEKKFEAKNEGITKVYLEIVDHLSFFYSQITAK